MYILQAMHIFAEHIFCNVLLAKYLLSKVSNEKRSPLNFTLYINYIITYFVKMKTAKVLVTVSSAKKIILKGLLKTLTSMISSAK